MVDRLKRTEGDLSENFVFDPAGNLLAQQKKQSGKTTRGNRLLSQGDRKFEYDARGNLIRETRGKGGKLVTDFQYNLNNQLCKVNKDNQTTEYVYDSIGRRIRKQDNFGFTQYLWAGDQLAQEQRNNIQKTYVYEPESFKPIAMLQDGEIYHYHLDHLGTPRELSDQHGKIVWQGRYKTYGNIAKKDVEEVENNLRFQGQYFDEETGLHYNRNRYYDPSVGQFTTQDPIGLLGGMNNYQYAPNPTGWVDPLGLKCSEADAPKEKYVIIGEGQAAVEAYAKTVRDKFPNLEFRTIKNDWSNIIKKSGANREALFSEEWELKAVRGNAEWIEQMHAEGYRFIDIGNDDATYRSPFYLAEKKRLADIDAKVYRAPSTKVLEARSTSTVSDRPLALSTEKLKNEGLI